MDNYKYSNTCETIIKYERNDNSNDNDTDTDTDTDIESEIPEFNCVDDIHEYIDFCREEYKDGPTLEHIKTLCYTKWGIQNEENAIIKLMDKYPDIEGDCETKVKFIFVRNGINIYLKGRVDAISQQNNIFFEIKSRIGSSTKSKSLQKCDEIQIKLYEFLYDNNLRGILVIA